MNNTPPPVTIATPTTPAEAAALWQQATRAGRTIHFFSGAAYQGTTAQPGGDLDRWLES